MTQPQPEPEPAYCHWPRHPIGPAHRGAVYWMLIAAAMLEPFLKANIEGLLRSQAIADMPGHPDQLLVQTLDLNADPALNGHAVDCVIETRRTDGRDTLHINSRRDLGRLQ